MEPIYEEKTQQSFYLRQGNLNDKPQYVEFLKAFVSQDMASIEQFVATKPYEEIVEAIGLLNHLVIQSPYCVNRPRDAPTPPPIEEYMIQESENGWSKL